MQPRPTGVSGGVVANIDSTRLVSALAYLATGVGHGGHSGKGAGFTLGRVACVEWQA